MRYKNRQITRGLLFKKNVNKLFLTICLFAGISILLGCQSKKVQSVTTEIAENTPVPLQTPIEPKNETQIFSGGKVKFKDVTFNYNQQVFGKVKAEVITERPLESIDHKPDYVTPGGQFFSFDLATDFSEMYLAVYPIKDFPKIYAIDSLRVQSVNKDIENFRRVLRDRNFRVDNQIPYIPFIDASQTFQVKVKSFAFQNGKGIFFLTHWEIENWLVSNRQLRYVFEGLTDDDKYYVLAEFPVAVSFLQGEASAQYEDDKINWSNLNDVNEMKRYKKYVSKIAARLENTKPSAFNPELSEFEKIITSLKIEK